MINKEGYDRIEYLREIVTEGDNASAIKPIVEKYKDRISQETLEILSKETDKEKLTSAISDYKAVVRFCEMVDELIVKGQRKEKALIQELKKH